MLKIPLLPALPLALPPHPQPLPLLLAVLLLLAGPEPALVLASLLLLLFEQEAVKFELLEQEMASGVVNEALERALGTKDLLAQHEEGLRVNLDEFPEAHGVLGEFALDLALDSLEVLGAQQNLVVNY